MYGSSGSNGGSQTPHPPPPYSWLDSEDRESINEQTPLFRSEDDQEKGRRFTIIRALPALLFLFALVGFIPALVVTQNRLASCRTGAELLNTEARLSRCFAEGDKLRGEVKEERENKATFFRQRNELANANQKLSKDLADSNEHLDSCFAEGDRLRGEVKEEREKKETFFRQRNELANANQKLSKDLVDVKNDFGVCKAEGVTLKHNLDEVNKEKDKLAKENVGLQEKIKQREILDLTNIVKKFNTGGDSWVCSDDVKLWSYGYTTVDDIIPDISVHHHFQILTDRKPIHFPSDELKGSLTSSQKLMVVGFQVRSTQKDNGYWKKLGLASFGGSEIEFHSSSSYWSSCAYEVEVFYIIARR